MNRKLTQPIQQKLHNRLLEMQQSIVSTLEGTPINGDSLRGGPMEVTWAFNRLLDIKLKKIEHALERQSLGTYGKCSRCGGPMWDRLEAQPYAEFCINCQTQVERGLIRQNDQKIKEGLKYASNVAK